jgi:hypothetical protein
MSAMKELLAELVEADLVSQGLPIDDHAAYMETQAALMEAFANAIPTGYECKRCGGPAPVGVGYWSGGDVSPDALTVTSCPCGYSGLAPEIEAERARATRTVTP